MKVTASIVIYNTDNAELCQCLKCLAENGVVDVWIVDNSPSASDIGAIILGDAVLDRLSIKYRHLAHNPGYGAGHNCAIREAIAMGAEAHLVLNSDVVFAQGIIDKLTEVLSADERVGQISPRILLPDGTEQWAQRLLPTPLDVFGRRFLPGFMMRGRNRRYQLSERQMGEVADIPYHQGSFMMFRAEALAEVDGFDERFFMYPEDIDITRRIHRNWRTIYFPAVSVTHAHRASSYKSWKMLWVHCRNMVKYFNKWGWWFDSERRRVNRTTLRAMHLSPTGKRKW